MTVAPSDSKPVAVVVGTRPEAIKMAPVVFALRQTEGLHPVLISSGQHREMLAEALGTFDLRPDVALDVMQPDQTLASLTSRALVRLDSAFAELAPAAVLVHGDTTTTLAAALAGFYRGIPVGHVEAGLRTGDLQQPFPEEANRILADRLCQWFYAPTERSAATLRDEGVPSDRILVTGNTVVDALQWMAARLPDDAPPSLQSVRAGKRVVLVTCHRRESFGEGLVNVCRALAELADTYADVQWVFPVHLNPRVREPVHEALGGRDGIALMPPLDYASFVWLMRRSELLLTDSGGLQEEGPALGKPVLVMRDKTERPEAIDAGVAALVGTEAERIVLGVKQLLDRADTYAHMANATNPFGDGRASERIAAHLSKVLRTTAE